MKYIKSVLVSILLVSCAPRGSTSSVTTIKNINAGQIVFDDGENSVTRFEDGDRTCYLATNDHIRSGPSIFCF